MRMKAAIIGASSEALHSIETAKQKGIGTFALDGNPAAEGLDAADEAEVVDISREQDVLRALQKNAQETGEPVDFVLTVPIGRYLTTIGAVNDALGLPGISRAAAERCTDKWLFHQALQPAGLRQGWCILVCGGTGEESKIVSGCGDGEDNMAAAAHMRLQAPSYPAILKPRYGSGSRGIFFLENAGQLEKALKEIGAEDYVLEEAVDGTEYGVDGAVTAQGFRLILLRKKLLTPPPARQAVGYLSVVPEEEKALYAAVESYLSRVVGVLGLTDCLFHADLMIQKDACGMEGPAAHKIFAIELSARPSGHNLHNLFTPMVTGVDMAADFMDYLGAAVKKEPELIRQAEAALCPKETKAMLIRYFDFEDCVITSVPSREELPLPGGICLQQWMCNIRPGDEMEKVTTGHSVMGRGLFVLEDMEREEPENSDLETLKDKRIAAQRKEQRLEKAAWDILQCFGRKENRE